MAESSVVFSLAHAVNIMSVKLTTPIKFMGKKDISAHERNVDRKIFLPKIIITPPKLNFLATFVWWVETISINESTFVG